MDRLSKIKEYRENETLIAENKAKKEENIRQILISHIASLSSRIAELIETGNACLQNNIELDKYHSVSRSYDSYEKGTFVANGITHQLGFITKRSESNKCVITSIGIINGGACGNTDLLVKEDLITGITVGPKSCEPRIRDMERFLEQFEEFETTFYAYVDQIVGTKPKTVKYAYKTVSKEKIAIYNNPIHEIDLYKMIEDEIVSSGKIVWNKIGNELIPSFSFDDCGFDIMYSNEFINVIRKYKWTAKTNRNYNFTFENCVKTLNQYGFINITEGEE